MFYNKLYIKKSDIENLKFLILFHGLLLYILEKKNKKGGSSSFLSGESDLNPPPHLLCINEY